MCMSPCSYAPPSPIRAHPLAQIIPSSSPLPSPLLPFTYAGTLLICTSRINCACLLPMRASQLVCANPCAPPLSVRGHMCASLSTHVRPSMRALLYVLFLPMCALTLVRVHLCAPVHSCAPSTYAMYPSPPIHACPLAYMRLNFLCSNHSNFLTTPLPSTRARLVGYVCVLGLLFAPILEPCVFFTDLCASFLDLCASLMDLCAPL
jgi:hypothetical protein